MFKIDSSSVDEFVDMVSTLRTNRDYRELVRRFSITRSHPNYWQHSDTLLEAYRLTAPLEWGILDYSRLQHQ